MSWTTNTFKNAHKISSIHDITNIEKDLNLYTSLAHIAGVLQNINQAIAILKPSDDLHYNFFYAAISDLDKKLEDINSAYNTEYQQKRRV